MSCGSPRRRIATRSIIPLSPPRPAACPCPPYARPPATGTSRSPAPQACPTRATKPPPSAACVGSPLPAPGGPRRLGFARAFSAASSPSRRSQAHPLAPRSTKPSTMPPPIPRAAPVTMTAWLSKWMSISRSFRRLRQPELRELADRQVEGAPHRAAVAAALRRREVFQRRDTPLLDVVAPMHRQGGQHLGQDGIVGVGPFALVGHALVVEGEDAGLGV